MTICYWNKYFNNNFNIDTIMAKKSVWIDNTTPPTNYIWVKTDEYGEVIGVYQYNGNGWIRIASGNNSIVSGEGVIAVTTLDGQETVIGYSENANPNTVVVRSDTGVIKAKTPVSEEDLNDKNTVVTVEMLTWKQIN